MSSEQHTDTPILVEFSTGSGLQQTSLSAEKLADASKKAFDESFNIIQTMSHKLSQVREKMPDSPDELKLQFGIKLDAQAGAMIAKSGVTASLNLTFTWKK